VVYVCGVPGMTEKLVRRAKKAEGMDERHVLYEKWW
jgi:NAD(P)H-flavin reductase